MKILAADDFPHLGGAQIALLSQMQELRRRGHAISVAGPPGGLFEDSIRQADFPFLPLDLAGLKRTWWHGAPLWEIRRHFRALLPAADIIHFNSLWGLTALGRLPRGAPSAVCAVHAFPRIRSKLKRYINYFLQKTVVRRAEMFITVSEAVRRELIRQGFPGARVLVIPNGIDLRRFAQRAEGRRERAAGEPLRIVMSGRLHPGKGQGVLVAACARLREQGISFTCRIIGGEFRTPLENLGYASTLRQEIERRGLSGLVTLAGFIQDVAEELIQTDVVVLPTFEESFGLALLEGMAMGCVPVASRTGGIPELVQHERNGLLFPPGDAEALAEQLIQLARRPDLMAAYSRAAQAAAARFDLQFTAGRLEDLYSSLRGRIQRSD